MSVIFVDTDNSNPKSKLYDGGKAGQSAAAAEAAMQKVVKKIIDKAPGFTTNKVDKAKGYAIRLEISKLEVTGHETKCTLSGSIVRYPRTVSVDKKGGGDEVVMVNKDWTGNATATGTSESSLLDCVEAIAEQMVPKSIPVMKTDFLRR